MRGTVATAPRLGRMTWLLLATRKEDSGEYEVVGGPHPTKEAAEEQGAQLEARRTEGATTTALAPRTRGDTNAGHGTVDEVRLASRQHQVWTAAPRDPHSRPPNETEPGLNWRKGDIPNARMHGCSLLLEGSDEVRVSGPSLLLSRSDRTVKGGPSGAELSEPRSGALDGPCAEARNGGRAGCGSLRAGRMGT
jgi:hypothetical protein